MLLRTIASMSVSVVVEIAPIWKTPRNFFAVGVQESSRRFGWNDVHEAALGDVAPFEVVRAHPVADDNVRALLIQGGGDVGADKPGAARDHIHAPPPSLRPANPAMISLKMGNLLEFPSAALRLVGLRRHLPACALTLSPSPAFNGIGMTLSPRDPDRIRTNRGFECVIRHLSNEAARR